MKTLEPVRFTYEICRPVGREPNALNASSHGNKRDAEFCKLNGLYVSAFRLVGLCFFLFLWPDTTQPRNHVPHVSYDVINHVVQDPIGRNALIGDAEIRQQVSGTMHLSDW